MTAQPATVIDVLGGAQVVGKVTTLNTPLAFAELAERRLSYRALKAAGARLSLSERETGASLGIAPRTLVRRKGKKLLPDESERVLNLARVVARALDVFDADHDKARSWFTSRSRALGQAPINLVKSAFGVEALLAELTRIEHGVHG